MTATNTIGRLLQISTLGALATAAAAVHAETVDQLYEHAKAETSLVFYAGGPTPVGLGSASPPKWAVPTRRARLRLSAERVPFCARGLVSRDVPAAALAI